MPTAPSNWTFDANTRERVDDIFAAWATTDTPGMTLGIYRDGAPLYTAAYGMANLEHGIPLSPGSIFHVASISKQFTDLCIALLAADGLLDIDDDIRQYIPQVPDFGPTITIRHLIHHTSGLRDQWQLLNLSGWREQDLVTDDDVLYLVERQQALNFPPNTEYLYSNTGYTLLSLIVRRTSGASLREFAQERIFRPLSMTSTHFHDDHAEIVRGRTQAYEPVDGGGYRISIPVFDVAGTTSLFTTVEDLAKWESNYLTGTIGGPDLIAEMQTPGTFADGSAMEYAWGLRVVEWRGRHRVGHSGADNGYRADFLRLPELGFAVTVLSNVSNSAPGLLTERVAEIVLGDLLRSEVAPSGAEWTTTPVTADNIAGLWTNAERGQHLIISAREGGAWLDVGDKSLRLDEERPGLFTYPAFRLQIMAGQDPDMLRVVLDGNVTSFSRVEPWLLATTELTALCGTYWSDELGVSYEVVPMEGAVGPSIAIRRRKFDDQVFRPLAVDTFVRDSLDFGIRLTFERSNDETVSGFLMTAGRIRNLVFSRQS